MNQSQILDNLKNSDGEGVACEITQRGLQTALEKLTGIEWTMKRDKSAKNAKVFTLIQQVASEYRKASNG